MSVFLSIFSLTAMLIFIADLLIATQHQYVRPVGLAISTVTMMGLTKIGRALTYVFGSAQWVWASTIVSVGIYMHLSLGDIETWVRIAYMSWGFLIIADIRSAMLARKRAEIDLEQHQTFTMPTVISVVRVGSLSGSALLVAAVVANTSPLAIPAWILHANVLIAIITQLNPPTRTLKNDAKNMLDTVVGAASPQAMPAEVSTSN